MKILIIFVPYDSMSSVYFSYKKWFNKIETYLTIFQTYLLKVIAKCYALSKRSLLAACYRRFAAAFGDFQVTLIWNWFLPVGDIIHATALKLFLYGIHCIFDTDFTVPFRDTLLKLLFKFTFDLKKINNDITIFFLYIYQWKMRY